MMMMCAEYLQSFKAGVPNLRYAYPQEYVKIFKGYASSRIALRFSMKQPTNAHKGVRVFNYFLLGGTQTEKG